MGGVLDLYTDASVRGRWISGAKPRRSQRGPAFGAYLAWLDDEPPGPPILSGSAYLGTNHGSQTAEMAALVNGVSAVTHWVEARAHDACPRELRIFVDNDCVRRVVLGANQADVLAPSRDVVLRRLFPIMRDGVRVSWHAVERGNQGHKLAHSQAAAARNQTLPNVDWRPDERKPEAA